MSGPTAWRVVSVYSDGDRIVESPRYMNRAHAEEAAEKVRLWREEQEEFEIEEVEP